MFNFCEGKIMDMRFAGPEYSFVPLSELVTDYQRLSVSLSDFGIVIPQETESSSFKDTFVGTVADGIILLSFSDILEKVAKKGLEQTVLEQEVFLAYSDDPRDVTDDGIVIWDVFTEAELEAGEAPLFLH